MSQITLQNQTGELVRIAIYYKPSFARTLATVAWQIVTPPSGGQAVVPIPAGFTVYAEYSLDPNQPDPTAPGATAYTTNVLSFAETSARFLVNAAPSKDHAATGAVITQTFDGLVLNEVSILNTFGLGVVSHLQKAGHDIYAPQVLWPGSVRIEDIRNSTLYLAVAGPFVGQGGPLFDEEISLTETPILEGGTAVVTGSLWKGYSITTDSGSVASPSTGATGADSSEGKAGA
jgi:hypothetical protein